MIPFILAAVGGYLIGSAKSAIKMADGGIYDQLGSGFHRYSVDERWLSDIEWRDNIFPEIDFRVYKGVQ